MSCLVTNEYVDFNMLKEVLEVTDGNLANHLKALEKKKLIVVKKSFVGRKPRTSYSTTSLGRKVFKDHIDALEDLINEQKDL